MTKSKSHNVGLTKPCSRWSFIGLRNGTELFSVQTIFPVLRPTIFGISSANFNWSLFDYGLLFAVLRKRSICTGLTINLRARPCNLEQIGTKRLSNSKSNPRTCTTKLTCLGSCHQRAALVQLGDKQVWVWILNCNQLLHCLTDQQV